MKEIYRHRLNKTIEEFIAARCSWKFAWKLSHFEKGVQQYSHRLTNAIIFGFGLRAGHNDSIFCRFLILKIVYKYIRIYLYSADPIFKRKTKHSSLTQPSYDRRNENRNRQTNNLSAAKNAKENLGVTSFFTTSPAYGLSQQVIYLTLFHLWRLNTFKIRWLIYNNT